MVTVIAEKEELTTPVHNGVTTGSTDHERTFQYIKDYQEVDFHRSPSCKPLPEDLFGTVDDPQMKSSIKGVFFVQVDAIELIRPFSNDNNLNEPIYGNSCFLLTITDGILTVQGITNDEIPHLSFNVKVGCKLLISGSIAIKNDLLQLTHDNTRFQYGSSTYPRPRSAYRGRGGGGSYRPSYEGRRGGSNGNNTRYDNDGGDSNFFKRAPPKSTLMDYITSFKISNDTKSVADDENQKCQDRSDTRRRNNDQYHSTNKNNTGVNTTNSFATSQPNHYPTKHTNSSDPIIFQPTGPNDQLDPEDDPSHSNYRERRNPLPPRLQRAQEERSRRNTTRYYDETTSSIITGDTNGDYHNGTSNNPLLSSSSSSSSYLRRPDQRSYIPNTSSSNQQHTTVLHSYPTHAGMLSTINSSGQTHLAYFTTNPGPIAYNLGNMSSSPYHNQQTTIGPSYPNEHVTFCSFSPYGPVAYLPPSITNGYNDESKSYGQNTNSTAVVSVISSADENETTVTNESQVGETNENKSRSPSSEPKVTTSSSSSSLNDGNSRSQQLINEQTEYKPRRDSNFNPRPRWKINDECLARWSEDREFYIATILEIQPPFCTVLFRDYHNYDQVHFNDLRILPRDQQYYPFVPPVTASSSDLNPLAASAYFPARSEYYSSTIDGCPMMPEAPPFPFNSAGTLYMCPPTLPALSRANRPSSCSQQLNRRMENGNLIGNPTSETTINSTSSPSKDSNDTSITDSTTTSNDDTQQQDVSLPTDEISSCSSAGVQLKLVTQNDEQPLTKTEQQQQQQQQQEKNTIVTVV